MATIDSNIALGVKPVQIENPINQYAAMSQVQNAQNQNALAQYQLSAAKRADESTNIQNQLYAKHYNPETGQVNKAGLFAELAQTPNAASLIPKLQAQFTEQEHKENVNKKVTTETAGLQFKQQIEKANKAISDIGALDMPEQALQGIARHLANGDIDQIKADQLKQSLTQAPNFRAWQKNTIFGILDAKDRISAQETERSHLVNEGTAAGQLKVAQGTLANAQQRLKNEFDPEVQGKIASAKASGAEYGKSTAKSNINLPQAIETSRALIDKIDQLVGTEVRDIDGKVIKEGTAPHPGFKKSVGLGVPFGTYIPGSSMADFKARYDEIQGGAFLEAFETLKGAGAISEKEGVKATAARNRMNLAQSEKEFISAAKEYQDTIRGAITRAEQKAGVNNTAPNTATPAASGKNDPLGIR